MVNQPDQLNLAQTGTLPPELYQQQQALNRQQQLASMLMQQGTQQPQGQMVSGRYVPTSFFQNLQPVANMLTGAYLAKQGDTEAAKLAQQIREGKATANQAILDKFLGKPAETTEMAGPYGQGVGKGGANVPMPVAYQPATKPDLAAALREIESPTNYYGAGKDLKPLIVNRLNPEKPSSVLEYEYAKENPGLADYLMNKAAAGAGRNITYVGNKSIAERVGPIMEKEQEKTLAANKIFDSASNLTRVLDTNKIYTGPAANVRLGIAQIANTAGFGGDTLEQKIANTRTGIQSLAQLTLQGRKEMKGEGAIQVQESNLAERAISGDINFTPVELKILANAAKRSAEYTQQQYDRKLKHMASDKDTAGLVPYFEVPPMNPAGSWAVKSVK
jgi:hypothetical protein